MTCCPPDAPALRRRAVERAGIFDRDKIALPADLNGGLDWPLIQNASKGLTLDDQAQDSRLYEPRVDLDGFAVESTDPAIVCGISR